MYSKKSKFLFQRNIVFNPKDANSYLYLAKIFEEEKNDYTVYIPQLKIVKHMKTREKIPLYEERMFHIFLFEKKDIRQKVKIELHNPN